jgi:hypothetical protein
MILTSWDDGHPLDLRIGEMLSRHGLSGSFFVPLENREGMAVMTATEKRELGKVHEIGSHTRTHCYLLNCDRNQAFEEITSGKRELEEQLGWRVDGFCYPGGKCDKGIAEMVRSAGFRYARTIENLRIDMGQDPWLIPTTLQFYPHDASTLLKNVIKHWSWSKPQLLWPRFKQPDFFSYARVLAEYCVEQDCVFHLWGHSWEIEALELWHELDHFFEYLSTLPSPSLHIKDAIQTAIDASSQLHQPTDGHRSTGGIACERKPIDRNGMS